VTAAGPHVGVGALVVHQGAVLLVQRGRPPGAGMWAIPGGRQRLGETLQQAAEREIQEETGVVIRATTPIYTCEHIEHDVQGELRYHYVIVDLAAEYLSGTPQAGDDASAAAWVAWRELAALPLNSSSRIALKTLFPAEAGPYLP
jgi:ADP-ribose pyrophosphatase